MSSDIFHAVIHICIPIDIGLPGWHKQQRICLQCRTPGFDPWVGKIHWRRAWQPIPVLLPGESLLTEEPDRLQSMGSQSVRHDWATKHIVPTAKSLQSCLTLCNPMDGSPPGSPVPGILQARTLEWVAISFSNAWKRKVKMKSLSCPTLSDPMDCSLLGSSVHGFSRQEYWSGVPLPSPH